MKIDLSNINIFDENSIDINKKLALFLETMELVKVH